LAENRIKWEWHPRQTDALMSLGDPVTQELLYGGAKGGGKSLMGCRWSYLKATQIIQEYDLKPSKYPILVGYIGRKRGSDLKKTTLSTWTLPKTAIPQSRYRINEHKSEIIIQDTVKIAFGGFDDRETIEKFNSMELAFAFLDQAEELTLDDVATLRGSLRLKITDKDMDYKVLWTANPRACWLKDTFVDAPPKDKSQIFIPALPKDNPFLPENYEEVTLVRAFGHRPELLRAYKDGDWNVIAGVEQIIKPQWILDAKSRILMASEHK